MNFSYSLQNSIHTKLTEQKKTMSQQHQYTNCCFAGEPQNSGKTPSQLADSVGEAVRNYFSSRKSAKEERKAAKRQRAIDEFIGPSKPEPWESFVEDLIAEPPSYQKEYWKERVDKLAKPLEKDPAKRMEFKQRLIAKFKDKRWSLEIAHQLTESL